MPRRSAVLLAGAALLVGVLPVVLAHGGSEGEMEMSGHMSELSDQPEHSAPSYFRHPEHWNWQMAHTVLMVLAWVICMPLAIFLSVARSRYSLSAQLLFHLTNALGVFAGFVYNHSTPDLYVNNAHHALGWVVVSLTIVWTMMSVCTVFEEYASKRKAVAEQPQHQALPSMRRFASASPYYNDEFSPRDSRDSGFASRQNSTDLIYQKPEHSEDDHEFDEEKLNDNEAERRGFLGGERVDRVLSKGMQRLSMRRAVKIIRGIQIFLEKVLLCLGFAAVFSGFIVSGGLFRGLNIFSGLAHYIKGGIFFWYGLLTLGRWMGAFTEFGWAWNVRPQQPLVSKWKSMVPSAEFTESFVIWLYGATNVFLEHLNTKGGQWTASDIEHLSITILFFGGGLLGILVECGWARELMQTTMLDQKSKEIGASRSVVLCIDSEAEDRLWEEPTSYRTPLNPMPALTIMLLGMMMGAHHQASMVSTMMHAQWGGLFSAFAVARGVTYITMYLKPPTSYFPSRPPSEIVAAFCLTSGGLLFMNSAADCVWAIESNGLDAMTIFTLTMGLTGVLLAWEVVLFAIKGWAVRKERAAAGRPLA